MFIGLQFLVLNRGRLHIERGFMWERVEDKCGRRKKELRTLKE